LELHFSELYPLRPFHTLTTFHFTLFNPFSPSVPPTGKEKKEKKEREKHERENTSPRLRNTFSTSPLAGTSAKRKKKIPSQVKEKGGL
jgi:hypothetical protein